MGGAGFYGAEQERNFREANVRVRRGGPDAPTCGAQTRTGGACRALPLKGSKRCIRHCGPKAARELRERQKQDYCAGRISHGDWTRAEGKRTVNKLRDTWKKNPWAPGATIDLAEHETTFRVAAGLGGSADARLPPAALDFLRWKYRRLQIDRKRDAEWLSVLRGEFTRRVQEAGPAPATPKAEPMPRAPVPLWSDAKAGLFKRGQLDRPRAARKQKPPRLLRRSSHQDEGLAGDAFAMMIHEHRQVLVPLLDRCRSDNERKAVVEALQAIIAAPDDGAARVRWMTTIQTLNTVER